MELPETPLRAKAWPAENPDSLAKPLDVATLAEA